MNSYGHIIGGAEVPSVDGRTMESIDPYTREPWATVAMGSAADADAAVTAAREAFDSGPWPRMGYEKRQEILHHWHISSFPLLVSVRLRWMGKSRIH